MDESQIRTTIKLKKADKKKEILLLRISFVIFILFFIGELALHISNRKYLDYEKTTATIKIADSYCYDTKRYTCEYLLVFEDKGQEYKVKKSLQEYYQEGYKINIRYNKKNQQEIILDKDYSGYLFLIGSIFFLTLAIMSIVLSIYEAKKLKKTEEKSTEEQLNDLVPSTEIINKKGFISGLVFVGIFTLILLGMIYSFISNSKYYNSVKVEGKVDDVRCKEDVNKNRTCMFTLSFNNSKREKTIKDVTIKESIKDGDSIDVYVNKEDSSIYTFKEYSIKDAIISFIMVGALLVTFLIFTIKIARKKNKKQDVKEEVQEENEIL